MGLWKYKYFVDVVESKSFTKAGEKNYVTQTAVSLQIASLEKSIGGKLIERGKGELIVTELGQIVYEKSKQMLEINEQMTREIEQQKNQSIICIGIDSSINKFFWAKMQRMIDEYYTENDFQFSKIDSFIGSRMLEAGAIDMYIGYDIHLTNKKTDIARKELCRNKIGVYVGKQSTFPKKKNFTLEELKEYQCYATELYPCSIQGEIEDKKVVNNVDTMKLKVEFNDGYAFADSVFFSFCEGKMKNVIDMNQDCAIFAFYKTGRNKSKLKSVLNTLDKIFNRNNDKKLITGKM